MTWVYIWLGVLALSLILEFVTLELVSIWVCVGSFVSMILALIGVGVEIQLVVAVVISVGCILGLRKFALKFLNRNNALFRDGHKVISDGALVAITLMIAESDPKEKDIMTTMVMNLLSVG